MSIWLVLLACLLFCLALYLLAAFPEGRWRVSYRHKSTASGVGTALLKLNALTQPSVYHAIEAIHTRPLLREEEGAGGDPNVIIVRLPGAQQHRSE